MFALDRHDLSRRMLRCADGPASFNVEATARGARVVSCDPLLASFLEHYACAGASRYVAAALPTLTFRDGAFDLVLSSHLLFLYSGHRSFDFHLAAVRELCRVANEVRIFPVLTLAREPSPYLNPLIDSLACDGWAARLERVGYEFQRGGNMMLRSTPSVHVRLATWPRISPK